MDFIVEVPTKKWGNKSIVVIVDRYTKITHFITMIKMDTERTINTFVKDRWCFHGLPVSIVSNRGS